jgi:hypothetical protein
VRERELVAEVRQIRTNLTGIVQELDHRRHELFDWRLQLRRHWGMLALIAGLGAALIGGSLAVKIRRDREARRALNRLRKIRRAAARFVDDPDNVAPREPPIYRKVVAALLTAAAATGGKKLGERVFRQAIATHV